MSARTTSAVRPRRRRESDETYIPLRSAQAEKTRREALDAQGQVLPLPADLLLAGRKVAARDGLTFSEVSAGREHGETGARNALAAVERRLLEDVFEVAAEVERFRPGQPRWAPRQCRPGPSSSDRLCRSG